jgi:hypothetical protein
VGRRSVRASAFSIPMLAPPSVVWIPRGPALAEGLIEAAGAVTRPHSGTAKAVAPAGTIRSRRLAHGARMPW